MSSMGKGLGGRIDIDGTEAEELAKAIEHLDVGKPLANLLRKEIELFEKVKPGNHSWIEIQVWGVVGSFTPPDEEDEGDGD